MHVLGRESVAAACQLDSYIRYLLQKVALYVEHEGKTKKAALGGIKYFDIVTL